VYVGNCPSVTRCHSFCVASSSRIILCDGTHSRPTVPTGTPNPTFCPQCNCEFPVNDCSALPQTLLRRLMVSTSRRSKRQATLARLVRVCRTPFGTAVKSGQTTGVWTNYCCSCNIELRKVHPVWCVLHSNQPLTEAHAKTQMVQTGRRITSGSYILMPRMGVVHFLSRRMNRSRTHSGRQVHSACELLHESQSTSSFCLMGDFCFR
jgi:hypothetical protein